MRRARDTTTSALGGATQQAANDIRETTVNAAAQRLARDLQAIPGIERFGALRLAELDRSGPRPLRTMWRIARDQLGERYGELTIGEVLDRYGRGGGPTAGGTGTQA
jgi:nucleotidyltransferase/DNA polymerase involved in DNA repair